MTFTHSAQDLLDIGHFTSIDNVVVPSTVNDHDMWREDVRMRASVGGVRFSVSTLSCEKGLLTGSTGQGLAISGSVLVNSRPRYAQLQVLLACVDHKPRYGKLEMSHDGVQVDPHRYHSREKVEKLCEFFSLALSDSNMLKKFDRAVKKYRESNACFPADADVSLHRARQQLSRVSRDFNGCLTLVVQDFNTHHRMPGPSIR